MSSARRPWALVAIALAGLAALGFAVFTLVNRQRVEVGGGVQASDVDLRNAYTGLCETRSLVEADPAGARDLFYGEVHSPLHDIARRAQEADRAVAARMLEAKNDTEQAFNTSAPPAGTAAALDRLLTSTEEALRSIAVTPSACKSA